MCRRAARAFLPHCRSQGGYIRERRVLRVGPRARLRFSRCERLRSTLGEPLCEHDRSIDANNTEAMPDIESGTSRPDTSRPNGESATNFEVQGWLVDDFSPRDNAALAGGTIDAATTAREAIAFGSFTGTRQHQSAFRRHRHDCRRMAPIVPTKVRVVL